jgi:hypothetical protein
VLAKEMSTQDFMGNRFPHPKRTVNSTTPPQAGDMGQFFFLHLFYGELKKEETVMFQYKKDQLCSPAKPARI